MKLLRELINQVEIKDIQGSPDIPVSGICYDSRQIKTDNCFMAIKGYKDDGLEYVDMALKNGATSVVSDTPVPKGFTSPTWVWVKDTRQALSQISAKFYDNPSEQMVVIGVTGTNGKTTIVSLIEAIFKQEYPIAKIGTLGMSFGDLTRKTTLTTPEAPDIFKFMAEVQKEDCNHLVMEVSSAALKLRRVEDIRYNQAVFSTFSGDHLDFHNTMDDYLKSKLILFKKLTVNDWGVINIDDPYAHQVIAELNCQFLTYGFSESADVRPLTYHLTPEGIDAVVQTPKGKLEIQSTLIGRINLSNILAAITSAILRGLSFDQIIFAIGAFKPIKGRLDFAYNNDFYVMIDYAHTDQALEGMLRSLKEICQQKIILVFGAGGARDKSKRPRMGLIASRFADMVVVTSDNPRDEEPIDIINDVIAGFETKFENYQIETDRRRAIKMALQQAQKGDIVVVAGKGHEDYQIFKDTTIHFDDYEVVQSLLREQNG